MIQHIIRSVTFFGSSKGKSEDQDFEDAKRAATLVAQSGRKTVNGGGPGIMLAATQGANAVKGENTVVYYHPELATQFEGKESFNTAKTQYEETNYVDRTQKLLELGDLYLIFNGGTGTISEFGMAWGLARLYFGHHKPLILFGAFWFNVMKAFQENMKMRPEEYEVYKIVTKHEEIIPAIEAFENVISQNRHDHKQSLNNPESFLLL